MQISVLSNKLPQPLRTKTFYTKEEVEGPKKDIQGLICMCLF